MATVITWPAVRAAINTIAETALSSLKTKVLARQVLAVKDETFDPDAFRSAADDKRINAVMFWRSSALPFSTGGSGEHTGPKPTISTARQRTAGKMLVQEWTVQFRVYLQFRAGSDASNSQADFDAVIDALTNGIAAQPSLGFDNELFGSTSDLQWTSLNVELFGDLAVHVGVGTLAVRVRIPLSVNP